MMLLAWMLGGTAYAATEWQTLLTEEFGTSEVSFYTGQASEAFYGIDDKQRYVIDGLNTNIDSLSALTKNLYYYYAEAECELLQTRIGDMAFCGLVFHYNKKIPGKLAYYVFYIYGDGYYGAKRVIGENAEVILPLTKSDYIDADRPNVLAVDARGTRFDLYINGRYVDGFTDVRIDGGGFGFYVSQQAQAAFDNFKVKVERRGGGPAEVEGPELLEGSSDNPGRAEQPRGDGGSFPDIPKDPNRPVYPWEVGVDKSETARKERSRDNEQDDIAERRLKEGLEHPAAKDDPQPEQADPAEEEPTKPREDNPADTPPDTQADSSSGQSGTDAGMESIRVAKVDKSQTAAPEADAAQSSPHAQETADPQESPIAPETANAPEAVDGQSTADAQDSTEEAAADETYINVSLPDQQNPPATEQPATEDPAAEPARDSGEEPAAEDSNNDKPNPEDVMRRMRESTSGRDDWSDDAPPYRPQPPVEKAEKGGNADAPREGELKGIELPPLNLDDDEPQSQEPVETPAADPEADPAGSTESEAEPSKDAAPSEETAPAEEAAPAAQEPGSLSLFPDRAAETAEADRTAGDDQPDRPADPPPAAEQAVPDGNPGELKPSANGKPANAASTDYDPFEGQPGVQTVYDDFTEQRWPVADGDTSSYRYFGAAYEIDNTKSDTMAISYQQGSFTDARFGVDVEYLSGLDYVGYGLATRFTVNNGSVSYYGLFVSQSGEILLLKVLDGKEIVLRDWSAVPNLSRTLSNRIGLELIGSSLQCLVNGEVVASVTDDSLQGGGYALLCGPGTATRFDNLTIKGFSSDQP
jgi:hypothetical protein